MAYIIEDGIPLPPRNQTKSLGISAAVRALQPGQSVVIDRSVRGISSTLTVAHRKTGRVYVSRVVDATHARVWCVAKPEEDDRG